MSLLIPPLTLNSHNCSIVYIKRSFLFVLFYVCVFFSVYVCAMYMQCRWWSEEGVRSLATGVMVVVSHFVGAGTEPGSSVRASSPLNS